MKTVKLKSAVEDEHWKTKVIFGCSTTDGVKEKGKCCFGVCKKGDGSNSSFVHKLSEMGSKEM